MSVIWIDSLNYPNTDWIDSVYGQSVGWSVQSTHPIGGRNVMRAGFGSIVPPVQNTSGSDTLTIGVLMGTPWLTLVKAQFLVIFAANGSAQLRFYTVPDLQGNLRIEAWSGDDKRRIATTSNIDFVSSMRYLEIQTRVHGSLGYVRFFIDGVTDGWVSDLDTKTVAGNPWHNVHLMATHAGVGELRFADLYIEDSGRVLGPSTAVRLSPHRHVTYPEIDDPLADFVVQGLTPRKRLIVLAGQSNMNGHGSDPYTGNAFSSPNPGVQIWNVETQQFEDLEANVNSGNPYAPNTPDFGKGWGPEMMMASYINAMQQLGGFTPSEVYIIKLATDASWVYPLPGNPTWSPLTPGNLTTTGAAEIQAAVTALGGWGQVEPDVDFFWHQGESESINTNIPPTRRDYITLTQAVFDEFEALVPEATFHYHRTVMHEKTWPVFEASESVIGFQRSNLLPGTITETSDLPLSSDEIHLTDEGYHTLGRRYFFRWFIRVLNAGPDRHINDKQAGHAGPDDFGFASFPGTRTMRSLPYFRYLTDWAHQPALAISPNLYVSNPIFPGYLKLTVAGKSLGYKDVGTNASLTLYKWVHETSIAPLKLTDAIDIDH